MRIWPIVGSREPAPGAWDPHLLKDLSNVGGIRRKGGVCGAELEPPPGWRAPREHRDLMPPPPGAAGGVGICGVLSGMGKERTVFPIWATFGLM